MKTLLTLFIFIASTYVAAQTIGQDTITMTCQQALGATRTVSTTSQFIFLGDAQIDWLQGSGEESTTYIVESMTGSWSDLNESGQVEFKVTLGPRPGSIFCYRDSGGLKVRIDMLRDGVNLVPLEFIINSFQRLNQ